MMSVFSWFGEKISRISVVVVFVLGLLSSLDDAVAVSYDGQYINWSCPAVTIADDIHSCALITSFGEAGSASIHGPGASVNQRYDPAAKYNLAPGTEITHTLYVTWYDADYSGMGNNPTTQPAKAFTSVIGRPDPTPTPRPTPAPDPGQPVHSAYHQGQIDYDRYDIYYGSFGPGADTKLYFHGLDPFVLIHSDISIPLLIDIQSFMITGKVIDIEEEDIGDEEPEYTHELNFSGVKPVAVYDFEDIDLEVSGAKKLVKGTDYYVIDTDGDGKKEIIFDMNHQLLHNGYSSFDIDSNQAVAHFSASSSASAINITRGPALSNFSAYEVKDIDGNGREELVILGGHDKADKVASFNSTTGRFTGSYYNKSNVIKPATLHGVSSGSFRVDESGGATYTLPITLPAGTAGVAPEIALNYNSGAGNGLLGLGWNVSGLSSISRCRQTLLHDGVAKPITWDDAQDRFCFGASRLYEVSRTSTEITFRTELPSHAKITGALVAGKISYFKVAAKDGSISYYGNHSSALAGSNPVLSFAAGKIASWSLSRFEDSAGNQIVYQYAQNSGRDYRVKKVQYAFGNSNSNHAEIEFFYQTRPDPTTGYTAGYKTGTSLRLSHIIVKNEVDSSSLEEIRRYNLGYHRLSPSEFTRISYIEAIQECVKGRCLKETKFDWKMNQGFDFNSPTVVSPKMTVDKWAMMQTVPFDFNGDGYLDMAWLENDEYQDHYATRLKYAKFNPSTKKFESQEFVGGALEHCNGSSIEDVTFCDDPRALHHYMNLVPIDYNLDGLQDLALFRKKTNDWLIFVTKLSVSATNKYPKVSREPIVVSVGLDEAPLSSTMVDVDSDGLPDIVTAHKNGVNVQYLKRDVTQLEHSTRPYKFTKTVKKLAVHGFDSGVARLDKPSGETILIVSSGDFNGDGVADLILADRQVTTLKVLNFYNHIILDNYYAVTLVNGRYEVLEYLGSAGGSEINSGSRASAINRALVKAPLQKYWTPDVNMDGYAEIVRGVDGESDTDKDIYHLRINNGAGFDNEIPLLTVDDLDKTQLQFSDLNSDGYPDMQYRVNPTKNGSVRVKYWSPGLERFTDLRSYVFPRYYATKANERFMFYDATGNGHMDQVYFSGREIHLRENSKMSTGNSKADIFGKVVSIENGLGGITEIDYELLNQTPSYKNLRQLALTKNHKDSLNEFYRLLNNPFAHLHSWEAFYSDPALIKSPVMEYFSAMPIVTAIHSSTPVPENPQHKSTLYYMYSGARFQAGGRGFLGFESLETHEPANNINTVSSYRQDWPYIGFVHKTERFANHKKTKISSSTSDYGIKNWKESFPASLASSTSGLAGFSKQNGIFFPFLKTLAETTYSLKSGGPSLTTAVTANTKASAGGGQAELQTKTVQYSYDDYGNIGIMATRTKGLGERASTTVYNSYGVGKTVTFQDGRVSSYPELGRLTSVTTEYSRSVESGASQSITKSSSFEYYVNGTRAGLLKEAIENPNTIAQLTTLYSYDSFGNLQSKWLKGINQNYTRAGVLDTSNSPSQSRGGITYYDSTGRYVEKKTVRAGVAGAFKTTEEIKSRNIYGAPTKIVSGLNGVEVTVNYDALGREIYRGSNAGKSSKGSIVVSTEDATYGKTKYSSCTGGSCPEGARFSITKTGATGEESISYVDSLARTIRQSTKSFSGERICSDTQFNALGQVTKTSEPFTCTDQPVYWNTTTYDVLGRIIGSSLAGGSSQSMLYDGSEVTTYNAFNFPHKEIKNGLGELKEVVDAEGGRITYHYDPSGNLEYVKSYKAGSDSVFDSNYPVPDVITTEFKYDDFGRKIKMKDPDKGDWEYKYNAFGELVWQKDAKQQVVVQHHDLMGRMYARMDYQAGGKLEQSTRWYFGQDEKGVNVANSGLGVGATVMAKTEGVVLCSDANAIQCAYPSYDQYGRVLEANTHIRIGANMEIFTTSSEYDDKGRAYKTVDVLGKAVKQEFNQYGFLSGVYDESLSKRLYSVLETNVRGQATRIRRGNGFTSTYDYYENTGQIRSQTTALAQMFVIQNNSYTWDVLSNLASRSNKSSMAGGAASGLSEYFCYDVLNRLVKTQKSSCAPAAAKVVPIADRDVVYDSRGNIKRKDGQHYRYDPTRPHAVSGVGDHQYFYDGNGNVDFDRSEVSRRSFEYTTFDKPTLISKVEGGKTYTTEFKYGFDRSRYLRKDTDENGVVTTTLYLGSVERIVKSNALNKITWKRHLGKTAIETITVDMDAAGNQLVGSEKSKLNYIYHDHLGSVDAITDAVGSVVSAQSMSFNAWGGRRSGSDWKEIDVLNSTNKSVLVDALREVTTRGFTGHEMLDGVGVIHMNGRIYDANLARFLQADPIVQAPKHTQSLNRYSYAWNNPLNATDPTGYKVNWHYNTRVIPQAAAIVVAIVGTIICSAACGGQLWAWALTMGATSAVGAAITGAGGQGIAIAAVSGAITGYLGAVGAAGGVTARVATTAAIATVSGITATLQGGKFGHGFISSGLSASSGMAVAKAPVPAKVLVAAIVGGTLSEATGGKFANGAATAAFVVVVSSITDNKTYSYNPDNPANLPELEFNVETSTSITFEDVDAPTHGGVKPAGPPSDGVEETIVVGPVTLEEAISSISPADLAMAAVCAAARSRGCIANVTKKGYPKDYSSRNTINKSAKYKSERDARNVARTKVGKDPVQVEPNKLRSQDGKWQYRGKPEDLKGHSAKDSPHIHLERLNPKTGEVLENWHLRW